MGDAGMVNALQRLVHIEDKSLLSGHLSLLFGDYQLAQDHFLASSVPLEALSMRRNLLQWDQALKLAQTLSPSSIAEICVHYGQQLEFRDEVDQALSLYELALGGGAEGKGEAVACPPDLVPTATMGVARYPATTLEGVRSLL